MRTRESKMSSTITLRAATNVGTISTATTIRDVAMSVGKAGRERNARRIEFDPRTKEKKFST
jgi:hypothetical protein